MRYTGAKTREISFPLGGIGSGCIGLAGNGQLVDWEIFNHPNKGSVNGFSHFAVKAEAGGRVLDARVLHGDPTGSYMGASAAAFTGFGHGVDRSTLAGVPHFRSTDFVGEFPLATIQFHEETFPGRVALSAFNPFIPLDDADSSIPAAFFSVEIENTGDRTIDYTVCLALKNPLPGTTTNTFHHSGGARMIKMASADVPDTDLRYGDISVATDAARVSYQHYWYRGALFDNLETYWRDLTSPGPFTDRHYDGPPSFQNAHITVGDHSVLAAHLTVGPRERRSARFVIAWNFPRRANDWQPARDTDAPGATAPWKNYYAALFKDSTETAAYALMHWGRLYNATLAFKNALFSSTLPSYVLDAVSANLSTLKSPTVLRLEDGSFYGFEGCHATAGCCEGSCTHVWNYAYALPFLFPALERSMRALDYGYNLHPNGKMDFRLQLPVVRPAMDWHACADGQFGGVIKAYHDWKICGDDAWLRTLWPRIKQAIGYAWSPTNLDRWDPDRTGVLWGRQHHTLDTELFGPNSYLTGFYLGALKAAAEMAERLGEPDVAEECTRLFRQGKEWIDANLFNGEYYHQQLDLDDKAALTPYQDLDERLGSAEDFYWDAEHGEIKYQVGEGCHVDQVVAQWHANICGLGEIFDRGQVRSALRAIYRHNFKQSMRDVFNPCRIFALDDEAALIICDWPGGVRRPAVPLTYAEEAMNGFEYQAAIHMIQEGLIAEGLEVVKAIRDRYDGEKRNPWNEFECGSNYARSMASYALLPALSGFQFDLTRDHIGFAPVSEGREFRCLWSLDSAWGTYERSDHQITLRVEGGQLTLRSLGDSLFTAGARITMQGVDAEARVDEIGRVVFSAPLTIDADQALTISVHGG